MFSLKYKSIPSTEVLEGMQLFATEGVICYRDSYPLRVDSVDHGSSQATIQYTDANGHVGIMGLLAEDSVKIKRK